MSSIKLIATIAIALGIAASADASPLWNVQFSGTAYAPVAQTGAAIIGNPGDTWNLFESPNGTNVVLADSTGAAGSVSISWTADGAGMAPNSSGQFGFYGQPAANLMRGYLYTSSTTVETITVRGLSGLTVYTIYLYTQGDSNSGGRKVWVATDLVTNTSSATVATANSFVLGQNYLVLTNKTDASGTLALTYKVLSSEADINGLQITVTPVAPTATTLAASNVATTNATLNGTVNPGNLATTVWFQWGTTSSYGNATAGVSLAATNAVFTVTNLLAGLAPATTYYFRMIATNSMGTNYGAVQSFATAGALPMVTTLAASSIGTTNATLKGTVNPNGLATGAWFQWGATTTYGNATAITSLAATNTTFSVGNLLAGLARGQTVHFRAVATNSLGTVLGGDLSFTTRSGTNTVTTLADDGGSGSLRQNLANALDGDTIVLATSGTLTLTNGELVITNSLTFLGPGATNLAISGNGSSRVFNITSTNAVVTIADVTICNGKAADGSNGSSGLSGGGILNLGNLTLKRCILSNNVAGNGADNTSYNGYPESGSGGGSGGGVYNANLLKVSACTLVANRAGQGGQGGGTGEASVGGNGGGAGQGGAIYNENVLTVISSTFTANSAGRGGKGGYNSQYRGGYGAAGGNGGGVFNQYLLTVRSSSFVGNSAGSGGAGGDYDSGSHSGGMGVSGTGGSGGGIFGGDASTSTLWNCLVALNSGGSGSNPDLSGPFTSQGYNLVRIIGGSAGLAAGINHDLIGTDGMPLQPLLGSLSDNGGPTPTIALLPGSPAIDAGDDTLTGTDQRGYARRSGQHVDIGAYELSGASLGYSAPSVTTATCVVSNLASGLSSATFSFSVNPNGLNTTAWIDYGVSTSYGGASSTLSMGYTNISVATNVTLTGFQPGNTLHYRVSASSPAGTSNGADQTFTTTTTGDLNGDGVLSDAELQTLQESYWQSHPLTMTGLSGVNLSQGTLQIGLSNSATPSFTVLASTNLSAWVVLTNGLSLRYQISDPDAKKYPQRFYRLRYP